MSSVIYVTLKTARFVGNKAELATLLWKSSASVQAGEGAKWNVWNVRFDYDLERKIRPIQRHPSTSPLSLFLSLSVPSCLPGAMAQVCLPDKYLRVKSRRVHTERGERGGEVAAIVAFAAADDFRCQHKCH